MKGDIKISKKSALLLAGIISLFSMADYVSVIKSDNVDYISAEPIEIMNVGSVVFRMDDTNPSEVYGGKWELITGDASLRLGNGSIQKGELIGLNNPIVPLVEHDHTMNHDHASATTSTDTHDHNINTRRSGYTGSAAPSWNTDQNTVTPGTTLTSGGNYNGDSRGPIDNDSHNHTINLPNYSGNTGKAGTTNATIDVRGQYITLNVWKRTS